ncbi:MAG: hypothetical protein H8E98_08470 [Bacteroidetes bacterium]|nr:hypothetical protein [Bacteroidota bacterium]MBL7110301.1 hypothetical protein [Candidatus Neomarinimicrobiota bacterium]
MTKSAKTILVFAGLFVVCNILFAQKVIDSSTEKRPTWSIEPPTGKYFRYFSGMGSSNNSLSDAKQQAISDVLSEIIMEKRITAKSEIKTFQEQSNSEIISKVSREIQQTGMSTTIDGLLKEEDYWEIAKVHKGSIYRFWILMKFPKPEYNGFDLAMMTVKQSYGVFPIVKSVFVPGWGQIHKKEKKKGLRLLTGFAVTLTAGIVSQSMSNNYAVDAQNADTGEWIDYYNTLSEQYYLASTISYILAGSIYGYNVYDAISSKGAKIYALNDDVGVFLTLAQGNNQVPQLSISIDL